MLSVCLIICFLFASLVVKRFCCYCCCFVVVVVCYSCFFLGGGGGGGEVGGLGLVLSKRLKEVIRLGWGWDGRTGPCTSLPVSCLQS